MSEIVTRTQVNKDKTTTVWYGEKTTTEKGLPKTIQGCKIVPTTVTQSRINFIEEMRYINSLSEREKFIYRMKKYNGTIPKSLSEEY